jgi:BON domain
MQTITKKTDATLKIDVLAELKYEPSVKVTDIGVLVKDGTVTLNGYATSYGEKWEAVRAVKRVTGVKAIADDIEVKLPSSLQHNDGDIATAAAHQIDMSTSIPEGIVQATVRDGWITLVAFFWGIGSVRNEILLENCDVKREKRQQRSQKA